jgi:RNA polymerase sigma-70 factor (ECF subfamily)
MDVHDDAHSGCLGLREFICLVSRKNLWRWEMGSQCIRTETKTEEALVRASRRGNEQAIETLFRRYQRQLLGAARRILGNTEDAEDALQDGLLSAYRNVRRFEGRSKFSTWLTRIVVNAALMRRRRATGLRVTSLDAEHAESQLPLSERLQAEDPNPEQLFAHTELKEMIQSNVGQLSSPLLTAFVLWDRRALAGRSREKAGYHADSNESADVSCSIQVGGELRTPARATEDDDMKRPVHERGHLP